MGSLSMYYYEGTQVANVFHFFPEVNVLNVKKCRLFDVRIQQRYRSEKKIINISDRDPVLQ